MSTVLAFNPDAKRFVTTSNDNTALVWDAGEGKEIIRLNGHTRAIGCAAVSSDGNRIITGSYDDTARIWDAATGKQIAILEGHTDTIDVVAFSSDGKRVLTASHDGSVRAWNAATGAEVARLEGHTGMVMSAAFSAEGLRIVTGAWDHTARVWQIFPSTQALVDVAKSRLRRCLTRQQRKAYFLPEAPPAWCVERHLWPYHTDDWQAWLSARNAWLAAGRQGTEPGLPKT